MMTIKILDNKNFQSQRVSIYFLNLNNLINRFLAKKRRVTNTKHQINCGKILVKRSASILYYQNFSLKSTYFSFLVIIFTKSSIQKNSILMLRNICRGFQDSQHQQILRTIDITIDSRFQQQKNFHQKLKILHILLWLQSQMLYWIFKLKSILILILQTLFLVFIEQLINLDQKVFNYLSQQFLDSTKLKELVLFKAVKIIQFKPNTKHVKDQMRYPKSN
ncbi:unnamed protein product [Paramecium octaurelia]|uniref:Transmembrane protein n=1 Tax=Paramecium octaurelia TaxID=43137 RepID=A0A8S1W9E4_PAROT|nr:unnamed protein product [Paramecium octaurelia]